MHEPLTRKSTDAAAYRAGKDPTSARVDGRAGCCGTPGRWGGSLALAALLVASGCNFDSNGSATGTLSVRITDAPVDGATKVVVLFTGIEVKHKNFPPRSIDFATPQEIDLLETQNGNAVLLLDTEEVEAGEYEWLRLKVMAAQQEIDSYIEFPGAQYPLWVPSGEQSGLKLVGGFTVPRGSSADFTIDFDLRKSVIAPPGLGGTHVLKPALRMVETAQTGAIAGVVDPGLWNFQTGCAPAVYVYAGADMEPGDMGGTGNEPLISALLDVDGSQGEVGGYAVHYLSAGEYTVAFTCDADQDRPEDPDGLEFGPIVNTNVVAGETTALNLPTFP